MGRLLTRIKARNDYLYGDNTSAIRRYNELIRSDKRDLKYLICIVDCFLAEGRVSESIDYVNRILAVDPNNYTSLMTAAKYWHKRNEFEKSYEFAVRALNNLPEPPPDLGEGYRGMLNFIFKPSNINLGDRMEQVRQNIKNKRKAEIDWAAEFKAHHERENTPAN